MMFNGQILEHIVDFKTKHFEDTYRLDRLLMYNSVLCALSRNQMLQLETFTQVGIDKIWRGTLFTLMAHVVVGGGHSEFYKLR